MKADPQELVEPVIPSSTEIARGVREIVSGVPCDGDPWAGIKSASRMIRQARAALPQDLQYDPTRPDPDSLTTELFGVEPFPIVDLERYARDGIPPIQWLREPWIAREDVGIAYGPPYIGKSTWMMQLAVAIAAGTPFLESPAANPAVVLIVDGEAGERSVARLALRCGAPIPGLHVIGASGQLSLLEGDGALRLRRTILELQPALVILDSVSTTFGLSNENDSAEVRRAMQQLYVLRDRFQCATFAVHHVGKSPVDGRNARSSLERLRGSSAFAALASLAIRFEAAPGGKALDAEIAKARDRDLRGFVRRIEEKRFGELIQLASLGDPTVSDGRLESELDHVSRGVVGLFNASCLPQQRRQIVEALSPKHSAKAVDRALAHLVGVGRLARLERGVYSAPESLTQFAHGELLGQEET